MTDLSWNWIALMSTVPPIVGVLVAYPLWRRREMIFGNLAGTAMAAMIPMIATTMRSSINENPRSARGMPVP